MSFDTDPRESITLSGAAFEEMCAELDKLKQAVVLMLILLQDIKSRTTGDTLTDSYTRKQIEEAINLARKLV